MEIIGDNAIHFVDYKHSIDYQHWSFKSAGINNFVPTYLASKYNLLAIYSSTKLKNLQ
jgi:hypothetical protein